LLASCHNSRPSALWAEAPWVIWPRRVDAPASGRRM
jgi:hypothetical protein